MSDELAGRPCGGVLDSHTLGGRALRPGVYCFDSDVELNATLILDAEGDRDAVWIFRIAGKLTTASDVSVLVVGNGYGGNAFWTAGTAALGARTVFIGNLFARTDITLGSGARLSGRLFARTGTVALNANDVSLCCAPATLAPATLPNGTVETPYRQTITASGGLAPYTFTVTSGSLPAGVALASNGTLDGTPAALGPFAFTITATDTRGCSSTAAYGIRIECRTRTSLPVATVGVDYAVPLALDGTCTVSGGDLPPGLSLEDCLLSGEPDTAGTFAFVVDSTDALGVRRSRCFTMDVISCVIHLVSPAPPPAAACVPYEHLFAATGGTEPYAFTAPLDALPDGSILDPDGRLFGTPSAPGRYPVSVTVTDALLRSCTTTYTLIVACPGSPDDPIELPDGMVADAYRDTLSAPACAGPWIVSFLSGDLPPGLLPPLPDGTVSGTPTKEGTYRFVVAWTHGECVVTREVTIHVGCSDLVLSSLPPMAKGVPYDETITVTGGIGPYRLSAIDLPAGLTITGPRIHGTPLNAFPHDFIVKAEDETSGCRGERTYHLDCPVLNIQPTVLSNGTVSIPYDETFAVDGGTAPYDLRVVAGHLPSGLTLSSGGTLSGTPAAAGTYAFSVRAVDDYGCSTIARHCAIDIAAATCPSNTTIELSPSQLSAISPNAPYSQAITAAGGTPPHAFSVTDGALPPGLALDPMTGILSGIPTVPGSYVFTITVIDANGCRASRCYTLPVTSSIPALSAWALCFVSVLLAIAGWIAIGRR